MICDQDLLKFNLKKAVQIYSICVCLFIISKIYYILLHLKKTEHSKFNYTYVFSVWFHKFPSIILLFSVYGFTNSSHANPFNMETFLYISTRIPILWSTLLIRAHMQRYKRFFSPFLRKIKLLSTDKWWSPYLLVKYFQCNKNQSGDICKLSATRNKQKKKESEIII